MPTYDDGEGYCPGDPELKDLDPKQLEKLQKEYDRIEKLENPIAKENAVQTLMKELNEGTV